MIIVIIKFIILLANIIIDSVICNINV